MWIWRSGGTGPQLLVSYYTAPDCSCLLPKETLRIPKTKQQQQQTNRHPTIQELLCEQEIYMAYFYFVVFLFHLPWLAIILAVAAFTRKIADSSQEWIFSRIIIKTSQLFLIKILQLENSRSLFLLCHWPVSVATWMKAWKCERENVFNCYPSLGGESFSFKVQLYTLIVSIPPSPIPIFDWSNIKMFCRIIMIMAFLFFLVYFF